MGFEYNRKLEGTYFNFSIASIVQFMSDSLDQRIIISNARRKSGLRLD
jgi:hypothetical protein